MSGSWSATEIAFAIIAVIQGVFALIWLAGAWWVSGARRAIAHWAAWAILSSITWLILAASFESPPLVGVLAGVVGALALQRGVRLFIGREPADRLPLVFIGAVLAAALLGPEHRHWQAVINFSVLAAIYCWIAHDLYWHTRERMRWRWSWVLALPVALGAAGYGLRALRALLDPASVLREMAADSALNVSGALAYIVLVLAFHAMLMALVVNRLLDELRTLSLHDGLTGLLNRRAIEETLQAQVRSSRRSGASFAVMMLDLDYFKRINDEFGHAVGDLALQHAARVLQSALRDGDRLARFGGEEFVVLMPESTLAQAQPVAERLRELLATHPLWHDDYHITLSVSIGIAEWRGAHDDLTKLLQRADAALFQAKVQGRNRVVAELPPEMALAM